jgi:Kdo2-lipid IVA lauroyltransferase/acyltransferase
MASFIFRLKSGASTLFSYLRAMNALSALLYYLVIIPFSWLPLAITYRLADLLYVVFFYITGYRKRVVYDNMKRSFPDKSDREIKALMKQFYHHFTDLFVESLHVFTISEREAMNRMRFTNPGVFNKHFQEGRNIILAGGHYNNWELFAVAVAGALKHSTTALYKPLNNAFFDQKMRETRGKYGLKMFSIRQVKDLFESLSGTPSAIIFATDQSPRNASKAYWTTFLHQDTAVLFGTEKYAVEYGCPVYFGSIQKIRRGFYEVTFTLITENPKETTPGEITEAHTRMLEADIIRAPQYWLWSHRRWKHRKNAGTSTSSSV